MTTSSEVSSVDLAPELAERLGEVAKGLGLSRNELVHEVLKQHLDDYLWQETFRYGEAMAKKHGITREDVPRLIEEYRAEKKAVASQ
jgi:metal-responsive CopG/Arc/MetJ family transcriptional regulator